jgi:hypothetical protein
LVFTNDSGAGREISQTTIYPGNEKTQCNFFSYGDWGGGVYVLSIQLNKSRRKAGFFIYLLN